MAIVRTTDLGKRTVTTGQVTADDLDTTLTATITGKLDSSRVQSGTVDVTPTSTESTVTVTFPSTFTATPNLQLTPVLAGTSPSLRLWASDLTTSGFTLHVVLDSGTVTSTSVHWLAVLP